MYIIEEHFAKKRLEICFSGFDTFGFEDISFLCLSKSGKIIDKKDFVYYNSDCRGDGISTIQFDQNKYKKVEDWRRETLPTSEDNAIWVNDQIDEDDDICSGTLYLSKLRKEIDEIIVLCSGDKYNIFCGEWWKKPDSEILRLYEQLGIPFDEPSIQVLLQVEESYNSLHRESIIIRRPNEKLEDLYIGAKLVSIKRVEDGSFIFKTLNETELVSLMDIINEYIE